MSSFLTRLIKSTNNEFAGLANDKEKFDTLGYIDTGSYALNALLSGSIYKGTPNNKIIGWAGEESTGKTFFTLACVKHFLDTNKTGIVAYFDSEAAIDTEMLADRGIDVNRFMLIPVATIQEFRTQAFNILEEVKNTPEEERQPLMFALDSFGMLSSLAETQKVSEGNDTKDFTLLQVAKSTFRVLTLKLGRYQIPMFITAHAYANLGGYGESMKISGGSGMKYAASQLVYLSKRKFKDNKADTEQSGSEITATMKKSRFTREGRSVDILLHYDRGLDRYYGLLPLAEACGAFKKVSTKYEMPDGTKHFESVIIKNPEKFFTKEVLDKIDEYAKTYFLYGKGEAPEFSEDGFDEINVQEENS